MTSGISATAASKTARCRSSWLVEPHADESRDPQAHDLGIDQRDITLDHALGFELPQAAQAGAGRKPDPLGQLLVRHAAVGLQLRQDLAIERIELHDWQFLSQY